MSDSRWTCAGRFRSARQTLAALGSLYGAGARAWACHRQPAGTGDDGGAYWLLSTLPGTAAADVVALHGGDPYPWHGMVPSFQGRLRSWPEVSAVELLARFPTHGPPSGGHHQLYVLTVPALVPTVVRHSRTAQADVSFVVVETRPLFPAARPGVPDATDERLLVVLGAPYDPAAPGAERTVPDGLVHALVSLPRTSVCRPAPYCARLLLDVRHALPLGEELLQPVIEEKELWLLGDSGEQPPVVLRLLGVPAPLTVQGPQDACPAGAPAGATGPVGPPPDVQLRVERDADAGTGVDAVLLTDAELPLLRRYLPGRALAEQAFLALGDGTQLLIDPAGLAASLPFGVPLRRIGPGACFVQSGHTLSPPLPPGARIRALGLTTGTAVACWQGGRSAFRLDPLVPVWTLWAPKTPPAVSPAVSEAGLELLAALEDLTAGAAAADAGPQLPTPDDEDPTNTLSQAARLHAEGRLVEAADAFRAAGDPWEAGRLYEQAALRTEPGDRA